MEKKFRKVAVVMGGPSKEREISFNTGRAILNALREKGYDAVEIDLEPARFVEQLRESGADVVFNAVHGLYGEDGRLQGLLEMLEVPYTGSRLVASALAMDKAFSKRIFQAVGVPTPACMIVSAAERETAAAEAVARFGLPLVVKPASQGSSIGTTVVKEEGGLRAALDEAFVYGNEIVIEQFIAGKELTVCIMEKPEGPVALPVIQIVPHSGAYDFTSKYTKGATDYLVPAPLSEEVTATVMQAGLAAYRALGCSGVARADVMLSAEDKPYVLEVNTIPGMTATSLVPKSAAAVGISFPDLCELILMSAR